MMRLAIGPCWPAARSAHLGDTNENVWTERRDYEPHEQPTTGSAVSGEPRRVAFESEGEELIGVFFPAAFGDGPAPAVAILGPMSFQKEQARCSTRRGSHSSATRP
jgi:hypothetical protein